MSRWRSAPEVCVKHMLCKRRYDACTPAACKTGYQAGCRRGKDEYDSDDDAGDSKYNVVEKEEEEQDGDEEEDDDDEDYYEEDEEQ